MASVEVIAAGHQDAQLVVEVGVLFIQVLLLVEPADGLHAHFCVLFGRLDAVEVLKVFHISVLILSERELLLFLVEEPVEFDDVCPEHGLGGLLEAPVLELVLVGGEGGNAPPFVRQLEATSK